MSLRMVVSHGQSASFLVLCPLLYFMWRYIVLICHLTSPDHLIGGLFEFIGGSSLQHATNLTSLVTTGIVIEQIKCF